MIRHHEGCPTKVVNGVTLAFPYRDPIQIPTIAIGFITLHGKRVTMGTPPLTMKQVDTEFVKQLQTYVDAVVRLTEISLSPDQTGALASFAYNVGVSAYKSSTLRRRINAKEWDDVEYQFLRWNKAGGRPFAGLTRRRQEESDLFLHKHRPYPQ